MVKVETNQQDPAERSEDVHLVNHELSFRNEKHRDQMNCRMAVNEATRLGTQSFDAEWWDVGTREKRDTLKPVFS